MLMKQFFRFNDIRASYFCVIVNIFIGLFISNKRTKKKKNKVKKTLQFRSYLLHIMTTTFKIVLAIVFAM